MLISPDHWYSRARHLRSPHCDARPDAADIALVVIHGISLPPGVFGGRSVEQLFLGELDLSEHPDYADLAGVEVSSHVLIDRNGDVTQFVPFDGRAWHAGVSSWRGRSRCNDFAVGVELEGTDDIAYSNSQYRALGDLLQALCARYERLTPDAIVGHQEIAPGRKTDPGPHFHWERMLRELIAVGPIVPSGGRARVAGAQRAGQTFASKVYVR